jgi:hypothetical protein
MQVNKTLVCPPRCLAPPLKELHILYNCRDKREIPTRLGAEQGEERDICSLIWHPCRGRSALVLAKKRNCFDKKISLMLVRDSNGISGIFLWRLLAHMSYRYSSLLLGLKQAAYKNCDRCHCTSKPNIITDTLLTVSPFHSGCNHRPTQDITTITHPTIHSCQYISLTTQMQKDAFLQ